MSKTFTKTILVTGGSGFIGSNFLRFPPPGYRIVAPSHTEVNILDKREVEKLYRDIQPTITINFAAWRNANSAELERGNKSGMVWKTNVTGVSHLFTLSQKYNSFFIHISTDMVFSGSRKRKGPYSEQDKAETNISSLSWYGWTKAQAERLLIGQKNTAVIRIGNVTQPTSDPALDYIGKILHLYTMNKLYPLFHDQFLTLTSIPSLLEVIHHTILHKRNGVFHVASSNVFTPAALGNYLIENVYGEGRAIQDLSIEAYLQTSPNRYPQYGGLQSKQTAKRLNVTFPRWQTIVDRYIAQIVSASKK